MSMEKFEYAAGAAPRLVPRIVYKDLISADGWKRTKYMWKNAWVYRVDLHLFFNIICKSDKKKKKRIYYLQCCLHCHLNNDEKQV